MVLGTIYIHMYFSSTEVYEWVYWPSYGEQFLWYRLYGSFMMYWRETEA